MCEYFLCIFGAPGEGGGVINIANNICVPTLALEDQEPVTNQHGKCRFCMAIKYLARITVDKFYEPRGGGREMHRSVFFRILFFLSNGQKWPEIVSH